MGHAKKVITIHVQNDREKEEFLREVGRLNLPAFIYVHGKLDSLKVNVQGTKGEIRDAVSKIMAIHSRVRARLYPDRRGLYRYSPDDLFREAGVSVPPTSLVRTLELLGETVELNGETGEIRTSLPWAEAVELVRRLGDALSEISLRTTRQIREVVLPVSAARGIDPDELLEILVELGLAEWKEDKFKYELVKNKEQAMGELLAYLSREEDEEDED